MKLKDKAEKFFTALMIDKIKKLSSEDKLKIATEKLWINTNVYPQNINGKNYNGFNSLMLAFSSEKMGYEYPVFLTFLQGKDLGISPLKGSEAIPLTKIGYNIIHKKDKNKKIDNIRDYYKLSSEERKEYNVRPYVNHFSVFNIDQTNIREANPKLYETVKNRCDIYHIISESKRYGNRVLDDLLEKQKWHTPIEIKQQDKAYYDITKDKIVLPLKEQFLDQRLFYTTLLHEMTHSTGAKDRLNRNLSGDFGSASYAKEELVAELTAAITGIKIDTEIGMKKESAVYLDNWLKSLENDPSFLNTLMEDVSKASKMIEDKLDIERRLEVIGTCQSKVSDKGKPFLISTISTSDLHRLKTSKGLELGISKLETPDNNNNTHYVHTWINNDRGTNIKLSFSEKDLDKLWKMDKDVSGMTYTQVYLSELSAEKKAENNLAADYVAYQVEQSKDKVNTQIIGAGFDATKQQEKETLRGNKKEELER